MGRFLWDEQIRQRRKCAEEADKDQAARLLSDQTTLTSRRTGNTCLEDVRGRLPSMSRIDGRAPDELRPLSIELDVQMHAEGSVLISSGLTKVLCAVSIEDRVPNWLRGKGAGWVTAEYAMLPRATDTRSPRERDRIGGRTYEIQRLIGRSLRAVTQLDLLGERTFTVDCDVLQADGGTRTAAITGSYIALALALQRLTEAGALASLPLDCAVAATSVGLVAGDAGMDEILLDLCYTEDSAAEVDCNIVKTSKGDYVEIQATAEGRPFSHEVMEAMLDQASNGLAQLFAFQEETLART